MKRMRGSVAAAVLAAGTALAPGRADAYCYITTAGVSLTSVVGVAVLLYYLVIKKDEQKPAAAPPGATASLTLPVDELAEAYLREEGLQMTTDLVTGRGPEIAIIEDALELKPQHRAAFERDLRLHREELLSLTDPTSARPARGAEFLTRVVELARQDEGARADIAAWASGMEERTRG